MCDVKHAYVYWVLIHMNTYIHMNSYVFHMCSYEWVPSTHMNASHHTYGWVTSHVWTRHITRANETCPTHKRVTEYIRQQTRGLRHTLSACNTGTPSWSLLQKSPIKEMLFCEREYIRKQTRGFRHTLSAWNTGIRRHDGLPSCCPHYLCVYMCIDMCVCV